MKWDDLPQRSWPEYVEPTAEQLADYLSSLTREQLVWMLSQQRMTWQRESQCFMLNHARRIEWLEQRVSDFEAATAGIGP